MNYKEVERWKKNSINVAKEIGLLDNLILKKLENHPKIRINTHELPEGILFGISHYDLNLIEIYANNPSTKGKEEGHSLLESKGMPQAEIKDIMGIIKKMPEEELYELFNQSGMDHELIGHFGNYFSSKKSDELAACTAQQIMAKYRGKNDFLWEITAIKLLPLFQKYHKGVDLDKI